MGQRDDQLANREHSDQGESLVQQLERVYVDHQAVQTLVRLLGAVPHVGGVFTAMDSALRAKMQDRIRERLKTFHDELARGERLLTSAIIENDEFLQSYFLAVRAAANSRRVSTAEEFARLLLSGISDYDKDSFDHDRFDYYLRALDRMTGLERRVLALLKRLEDTSPKVVSVGNQTMPANDYQIVAPFWNSFEQTCQEHLALSPNELESVLVSLGSTGFVKVIVGMYLGYEGKRFKTTALLDEFIAWIWRDEKGDLSDSWFT